VKKHAKSPVVEPAVVARPRVVVSQPEESSVEDIMKEYNRTYSYDDLVKGNYRDDIDQTKKEVRV